MICPACVVEIPDDDLFCENCGVKLGDSAPEVPQPKCACGAPANETDEDGFCLRCGLRAHRSSPIEPTREPQPSDHIEQQLSPKFAAVSDRGRRHAKNEDRFGILESSGAFAMVVCDGVSTSQNAEVASSVVADTVLESLSAALGAPTPLEPAAAIRQAITAAAAALNARANPYLEENPPSTTVVTALVAGGVATIGWLGDSRAYWIDLPDLPASPAPDSPVPAVATQLTQDHSWLNSVVGSGEMTPEIAARSPQAHAITRWLGADADEDLEIDIVRHPIPASNGILLLCTDGLWNYFPTPQAVAILVQDVVQNASRNGEDALAIAHQLVDQANRRGGHDNITAAVLVNHQPESGVSVRED
jgi:serine/threonine protein phosphatase PrpC